MLKLISQNKVVFLFSTLIIIAFVGVRFFENILFYDPLNAYFVSDYLSSNIPKINIKLYYLNLFFRYSINTVLSITLIYLFFKEIKILRFILFVYIFLFVFLLLIFSYFYFINPHKLGLFYARKFIIHPLFILLFLPALFYQKQIEKLNK